MFRLQNNVPEIYVSESRDFQLFCRLVDFLVNATKYNIDSITDVLDTTKINDNILSLLATKLGFFPKYHYDSNTLRYMLAAFPYMMKYKGTKKAIEIAVTTILKSEANTEIPVINVINVDDAGDLTYKIEIYTLTKKLESRLALEELLTYVIPTGYILDITYGYKVDTSSQPTSIVTDNVHYILKTKASAIATVYTTNAEHSDYMKKAYTSTYFHSQVIPVKDLNAENN